MQLLRFDHHKWRAWRRYALPATWLLRGYSPFPLSVSIHVTMACNLRCEMCCQQQNEPLLGRYTQHMQLADYIEILDNLERSLPVKPRLHLTGGEPSIHPQFLEMVSEAARRGFPTTVTSNGALIEKAAKELVDLGVHNITLSLDGPEEVHNRIRGRQDSYARVVAAARALRAARADAGALRPAITLNCVVTRHNYRRLAEMPGLAQEVGGDCLTIQQLLYVEGTPFANHGIDEIEQLAEQLAGAQSAGRARGFATQLYPYVPVDQLRHYYTGSVAGDPLRCVEPWLAASVLTNGDVLFCFSPVAGNALETPFDEIWRGETLTRHRQTIARAIRRRDGLPSGFCQRCCYRLYT